MTWKYSFFSTQNLVDFAYLTFGLTTQSLAFKTSKTHGVTACPWMT